MQMTLSTYWGFKKVLLLRFWWGKSPPFEIFSDVTQTQLCCKLRFLDTGTLVYVNVHLTYDSRHWYETTKQVYFHNRLDTYEVRGPSTIFDIRDHHKTSSKNSTPPVTPPHNVIATNTTTPPRSVFYIKNEYSYTHKHTHYIYIRT